MSTKVCVEPVKPGWADAVTLGVLENMIAALYGLGYDIDTPVTFLYDHRHVWLETVHDVDDDDFDIEVVPEPRVWESSNNVPEDVVVQDSHGSYWKWKRSVRYLKISDIHAWDDGVPVTGDDSKNMSTYAPFTEVLT